MRIRDIRHYSAKNVYIRDDGQMWMKQNATHHARVKNDGTNWVQVGGVERIGNLDEIVDLVE